MFCADNYITNTELFDCVSAYMTTSDISAIYPARYAYRKDDNSLNRYFSLFGGNDPVCYYLGKNDREPHVESLIRRSNYQPSYGCNGFFYKAEDIKSTDLNHYYPMDNALEVKGPKVPISCDWIWHRTSDHLITFLLKRYKYARDLYCDRKDRRWKMLDTAEDYWRVSLFVLSSITVILPLYEAIRGYSKIKDKAWFWHPIVCLGFTITYGILTGRTLLKRLLSYLH